MFYNMHNKKGGQRMTIKKTIPFILIISLVFLSGCTSNNNSATHQNFSYQYVGSIQSDKYHNPDCKRAKKIKPSNEIWFNTKQEAAAQGYRACKVCKP